MPHPKIPDSDFIEGFERIGPHKLAQQIGINVRRVYSRRKNLERKYGHQITGPDKHNSTRHGVSHPGRIHHEIRDGIVLIGSDAHYWPGIISTAHRAFVRFCNELKPKIVVKNGDVMDFPSISRHTPIGWEDRPAVIDEIESAQERLAEIRAVAPKAKFIWPLGNHDGRLETRLATLVPEFAKVKGVHLKDHFPMWEPCWSCFLNDDVVIKHRFRGGIHATHNNVLWAGKTIITGHLHSLQVRPFSDYNGTRWGVDSGTMADPYGPQFQDYTEDSPKNWRAGFIVLTFFRGELLDPEIVRVFDENHVVFRGKVIRV